METSSRTHGPQGYDRDNASWGLKVSRESPAPSGSRADPPLDGLISHLRAARAITSQKAGPSRASVATTRIRQPEERDSASRHGARRWPRRVRPG